MKTNLSHCYQVYSEEGTLGAGRVAHAVVYLLSKHEDLSSKLPEKEERTLE
jgi:hypothetical protein